MRTYTLSSGKKQHEFRKFLTTYKIRLKDAAAVLGVSTSHLCNVLAYRERSSPNLTRKMEAFQRQYETQLLVQSYSL